jgi:O-antigen ligase
MTASDTKAFASPFNPFQKVGVYSILALLFVAYSRIFDLILVFLHVPTICFMLVLTTAILCGAFQKAFTSRIGIFLLAFSIWMLIDVPFSVWKGGSFQLVTGSWPKALMVFVGVAGLATTLPQCKQVMSSIAYAAGVLAAISLLIGDSAQGRLILSTNGKFANPNDLAQALLIALPLWVFMARNPNRTPFRQIIPIAFIGLILIVLAKTGSRGAFVAFCVVMVVVFWNASPPAKLGLLIAGVLLAGVGAFLLPKSLINRYVTMSSKVETNPFDQIDQVEFGDNTTLQTTAVESATSRMEMLKESVRLTISHPIFGVGPGMFQVASAETGRGRWLETHNSYTQISSECGIPALIIYLAALLACLSQTTSIYRRFRKLKEPRQMEIASMAFWLRSSLLVYCVTAFFSSVAYQLLFPCFAGLTVAFMLSVREDLEQLRAGSGAKVAAEPPRVSGAHAKRLPWQPRPVAPAGYRSRIG